MQFRLVANRLHVVLISNGAHAFGSKLECKYLFFLSEQFLGAGRVAAPVSRPIGESAIGIIYPVKFLRLNLGLFVIFEMLFSAIASMKNCMAIKQSEITVLFSQLRSRKR